MGDGSMGCDHPFVNLCDRFVINICYEPRSRYTVYQIISVMFLVLYHERRKFGERLHLDVYA